jgi:hypothetical protein
MDLPKNMLRPPPENPEKNAIKREERDSQKAARHAPPDQFLSFLLLCCAFYPIPRSIKKILSKFETLLPILHCPLI